MSKWTNIHEIMQDLSVAQGFVPASVQTFGNGRPPTLNIDEESEDQSYYECGGNGDFEAPDYSLIQHMLNMVKESKDSSDDDSRSNASDLNPLSPEFVPQAIQKKIKKNVALTSIITANEMKLAAKRPIPKDVIPVMFKRKSQNQSEKSKSQSVSPLTPKTSSPESVNQYIPSSAANAYYSKYVEKNLLREQFEGDIWSRAERQMKEIDARKKRAEPQSPQRIGYDIVSLPQHRHLLTEKCVVCNTASKHGYDFKDES